MNTAHVEPKIIYVNTEEKLQQMLALLKGKSELAFDTEFDRFYREYGFKLSLLQIFDGETCYLVDPLAKIDLHPLWTIFEDPTVCKIVYSCSEDIQILKINGCNPKNIYDLQIAAKLCNHSANSLSDLLMEEFSAPSDKTLQRSNWRRRPLSKGQLHYAGNDVSMLIRLKHLFDDVSAKRSVTAMIVEENKKCENIPVAEYSVKLSVNQKRKYDAPHQKIMLELLELRNAIAISYNVPPANIVSDATLENIIEDKQHFLRSPFSKGFSKRFAEDQKNQDKFSAIIEKVSDTFRLKEPLKKHNNFPQAERKEVPVNSETDRKYEQLYDNIIEAYGKEAGEFILRGFKKSLSAFRPQENKMRSYQQDIIKAACEKLNIDFGK